MSLTQEQIDKLVAELNEPISALRDLIYATLKIIQELPEIDQATSLEGKLDLMVDRLDSVYQTVGYVQCQLRQKDNIN